MAKGEVARDLRALVAVLAMLHDTTNVSANTTEVNTSAAQVIETAIPHGRPRTASATP